MSGDVSVFSRFVTKFIEIIAAGLATAVSGYLLAHISGVLSYPVPEPARTVIEDAPNAKSQAAPPSSVARDLNNEYISPTQDGTASASPVPQVAPVVNSAKAAPPRKRTETATNAAETKRGQDSLVAQVRAALANVKANRTGPLAEPLPGEVRVEPAGASQLRPSANSSPSAVPGPAPISTVELGSLPPQVQLSPLTAVEIPARPIAAAQPPVSPPPERETGIMSNLEEMLRHDPLAGSEDAPRPPAPVGQ
jgi:hypothetical protein